MSSTLGLILTSAVVAAVVSAIVGGVFTMWNDHLRRAHESHVRQDDRGHDREMQALADKRAQRDHRGSRIYENMLGVVEAVVAMRDQVERLRLYPQDYRKGAPELSLLDEREKVRIGGGQERLGEYTKEVHRDGDQLANLLLEVMSEAREALAQAEAALE
jgi:hypothetical protein